MREPEGVTRIYSGTSRLDIDSWTPGAILPPPSVPPYVPLRLLCAGHVIGTSRIASAVLIKLPLDQCYKISVSKHGHRTGAVIERL